MNVNSNEFFKFLIAADEFRESGQIVVLIKRRNFTIAIIRKFALANSQTGYQVANS